MKKINLFLISALTACISACSTSEEGIKTNDPTGDRPRFYGVGTVPETRGVAQKDKLWYPGTEITVKLLSDPFGMQQTIQQWASEWEEYADIKFKWVGADEKALVRIAFDYHTRYITWSYTGTDCKYITDQNEPTANFDFWEYFGDEDRRGDVLRIFGQVLGLELEYRHLGFDPGWTTEAQVRSYWEGVITDIDWDQLREYVFDPLEDNLANVMETEEYDPESIMIWPFDRRVAVNGAREYNLELSETDKEFIGTVYPKVSEEKLLFTMITDGKQSFAFFGIDNGDKPFNYTVDWGDGTCGVITNEEQGSSWHFYDFENEWTIKVYGEEFNTLQTDYDSHIGSLIIEPGIICNRIDCTIMSYFEITDNTYIKEIYLWGWDSSGTESYYIDNCPKVVELFLCGTPKGGATEIVDYPNLRELYLYSSKTNSITIANCPLLENATCIDNNNLINIVVENCPIMGSIGVYNNRNLYSASFIDCPQLRWINTLEGSGNPSLGRLLFSNLSPSLYNYYDELQTIVHSLPLREASDPGIWTIEDEFMPYQWLVDVCTAKNWTLVTN